MKHKLIVLLSLFLVISSCTSTTRQTDNEYNKNNEDNQIKDYNEYNKNNEDLNNINEYITDVIIRDFNFIPSEIRIKKGIEVTWNNEDESTHSIETDDLLFTSDELQKGDSVIFRFDKIGTFNYHCGIHPSMKGTIIVE